MSFTNIDVAIMLIIVVRTGIEHEETLLSESAARETSLNTQIIEVTLHIQRIFHHDQYHRQNIANSTSCSPLESLG